MVCFSLAKQASNWLNTLQDMIQLFCSLVGSQTSKEEALENLAWRENNRAKKTADGVFLLDFYAAKFFSLGTWLVALLFWENST